MSFSLYGLLIGVAAALVWTVTEKILRSDTPAHRWSENTWNWGLITIGLSTLIGARLYHVVTDWQLYASNPFPAILQIWNGGLGWYGGLLGLVIGAWIWRRWQTPPATGLAMADSLALALPWGQAIGRWGNYFNQELFGPPTTLPWGIFIAPDRRPDAWLQAERFHPLFLYESLASLVLGIGLYLLWRWGRNNPSADWLKIGSGSLAAFYGMGFGTIRFSLDFLRDDLQMLGILTVSQWFSLALIVVSLLLLQNSMRQWLVQITKVSAAAVVLLGVTWFSTTYVQAQVKPPLDLSITPAVVEIVVQPGRSLTRAFTLKNQGAQNLEATLTLRDFASDNRSGAPLIQGLSEFPYASLSNSDIDFNQTFPLPSEGEQQIVLSLKIPEDAQERDWYVVLLAETEPVVRDPLLNSQATSQGAIGATLMIRVSRTEKIPLQWGLTFPNLPRFFDSLRPLHLEPLVANPNPSLAVPELVITVRNWRGELVHTQEGLPERVLAQSTRFIRAQQPSQDDPRTLEPIEFVFDPPFALGKYTVEGRVINQAGEPLVVTQTLWALPFSLTAAGLALVGTWLTVRFLRRRHLRRKTR